MEYVVEKKEIIFNEKVINELDRFTINFTEVLKKYRGYVIVSGYPSILLGRSRSSEDIDFLVPKMEFEDFSKLFNELISKGYECANSMIIKEAYESMDYFGIRFFERGYPTPNIELKMIKRELDMYSFEHKVKVIFGDNELFISPLELQIAYKLFLAADGTDEELSSDKDIEDARHLYRLFKDRLNKDELLLFMNKLGVKDKMRWLNNGS
ncbi:MAG: hypothetical protein AABW80_05240 [Nanoarchaeota archaeon]